MSDVKDVKVVVARIGLVASTLILWKSAAGIVWAGLMVQSPFAIGLIIVASLVSFLCLAASVSDQLPRRHTWAVVATFVVLFACFAFRDFETKAQSSTMPTTDGHVYMDVAARMVLQGLNPYSHSLDEAFRLYRMPLSFSTPLIDGEFSDRLAYPALCFLSLVPFIICHIPTYVASAIFLAMALGLIVWRAPWWARGCVLALFALDETFLSFAFNGVTDTLWALLLVGAVFAWRKRQTAAFVLVGLACAQKQQPWFLLPYLVVQLCWESSRPFWRGPSARLLLTVALVFTGINLPFFVTSPKAWLLGIGEPLLAPMVQLSEGLTALSMTGYVPIPREGSAVIFWVFYIASIVIFARHPRRLRGIPWVMPGIVLWFGYRALMSYWVFFALTAVAVVLSNELVLPTSKDDIGDGLSSLRSQPTSRKWTDRSWRVTACGCGTLALFLVAYMAWCSARPRLLAVRVQGPIEAVQTRVVRLRLRVDNLSHRTVAPYFTVQSTALQPLAWVREQGPYTLEPGTGGDFVIRAPRPYNEFDIATGARLSVSDRGHADLRAFVSIPKDATFGRIDAVANPKLEFADQVTGAPVGWIAARSDQSVAVEAKFRPEVTTPLDQFSENTRLSIRFASIGSAPQDSLRHDVRSCEEGDSFALRNTMGVDSRSVAFWAGAGPLSSGTEKTKQPALVPYRYGRLATTFALPESDLTLNVRVPANANRIPFRFIYGVRLVVGDWTGIVLFGADQSGGTLPTGERFVNIAAPREQWASVSFPVRPVLNRMGAPVHERRFTYDRDVNLDVSSTPVTFGWFAGLAGSCLEPVTAEFGEIGQTLPRLVSASRGLEQSSSALAGNASWRGERARGFDNFAEAARRLEEATAIEPTSDRLTALGDAYLLDGRFESAAHSYAKAISLSESASTHKGMGWALYNLGDFTTARQHFERAREEFVKRNLAVDKVHALDAQRGIVESSEKLGDCVTARKVMLEIQGDGVAPPKLTTCE